MSLEAVIDYFSEHNMDHRVMVLEHSTATVEKTAEAHGVEIIPAAGSKYSSIRLTLEELQKHSNCKELVDVCKETLPCVGK